jgi:predicted tellurium resistance membrane protein TerC
MTNNDQQNTTQKTKDQATWTPLKTGGGGSELGCSSFCSTVVREKSGWTIIIEIFIIRIGIVSMITWILQISWWTNIMQQYLIMEGLNSEVWRYQREVIRSRKSKKDRQHNGQKTKDKQPSRSRRYQREVIRSRKSKKDRHHNGQKKEDKQRSTKYYTKEKGQDNNQEKKSKMTNNELLWYTVK